MGVAEIRNLKGCNSSCCLNRGRV